MFGGAKGKFNGLALLQDVENENRRDRKDISGVDYEEEYDNDDEVYYYPVQRRRNSARKMYDLNDDSYSSHDQNIEDFEYQEYDWSKDRRFLSTKNNPNSSKGR